MRFRIAAFILVSAAALCGCASVPMAPIAADNQAKQFQPVPDKGVLYIYRSESFGGAVKMDVMVDSALIGDTAAETYFRMELPPGKHTIVSKAENTDEVDIDVQPGQLYFVWQEVKMGILYARNKLHIVQAGEGEAGVRECKLAAGGTPMAAPAVASMTAPASSH